MLSRSQVDANRIKYGAGALREVGCDATSTFGMKRVALFTDMTVKDLPCFAAVHRALVDAGADVVLYDNVLVEPTDRSFNEAIAFAVDVRPDGFVSVGGGSVMDTCKAVRKRTGTPPHSIEPRAPDDTRAKQDTVFVGSPSLKALAAAAAVN